MDKPCADVQKKQSKTKTLITRYQDSNRAQIQRTALPQGDPGLGDLIDPRSSLRVRHGVHVFISQAVPPLPGNLKSGKFTGGSRNTRTVTGFLSSSITSRRSSERPTWMPRINTELNKATLGMHQYADRLRQHTQHHPLSQPHHNN